MELSDLRSRIAFDYSDEKEVILDELINQEADRKRIVYGGLIIVTIALGLLSRTAITPKIIYPYLGDFLYALLYFWLVGFLFTKMSSLRVAIISVVLCYLIEMLQLYQADWINAIRSYKIGGLVLGYGFLWSDIVSYTLGGITGYVLETFYYKSYDSFY